MALAKSTPPHSPVVAELLRSGHLTLEKLEKDYAITATRHKTHPNLVSLKYDQIRSDFIHAIVRECRGIILDEDAGWRVVARGFDKFFNVGESLAPPSSRDEHLTLFRAYEKKDGSLIMLYYYKDQWRVATTGTPDASGQVGDHGITFAQLFWQTFFDMDYVVPDPKFHHLTYLFELMSPLNRVVVRHERPTLSLIGARNLQQGIILQPGSVAYVSYQKVAPVPVKVTISALRTQFAELDPLKHKGFVLYDDRGDMVKLKHPGYVALHHMISSMSAKHMLDVIRRGEAPEAIAAFPEYQKQLVQLQAAYDALVRKITDTYAAHAQIKTQKDFALAVKDFPFSGALFSIRRGKVKTPAQFLLEMRIDQLMEWIDRPQETSAAPTCSKGC